MIGLDPSPQSKHAFQWLMRHSNPTDSIILATGIKQYTPVITPESTTDRAKFARETSRVQSENAEEAESSRRLLNSYLERCSESNRKCSISTFPIIGGTSAIGESLCTLAEENRVDSLVLGQRGLGVLKRAMLGSVSEYCANNCSATITIVKAPEKKFL